MDTRQRLLPWSTRVIALAALALSAAPPAATAEDAAPCAPRALSGVVAETTPEDVAQLVRDFVAAYNEGDTARLDAIFAAEPEFEWYSVEGERVGAASGDRASLVPYFEGRHRLRDRLRLRSVNVNEEPGWHGGYDFGFELRRKSQDAEARGRYHGKGAAGCSIFVWSMGRED